MLRFGARVGDSCLVAMSGGVDSAVTAYLLKKQGLKVLGVYMRNWDSSDETGVCTSEQDWKDVQSTCRHLEIPCEKVDFSKEYWNRVFVSFLEEYKNGRTPNPDIWCNREIKFGSLFRRYSARTDWFATGHYARKETASDGSVLLLKGIDPFKDQSYPLARLSQEHLHKVLFPIGAMIKADVKKIALNAGIPVANKRESMGICFVGKRKRFKDFLENYITSKEGNFISVDGKDIGKHDGLSYYTIGQKARIPGAGISWHVVRKDLQSGNIIIAQGLDHPALFVKTVLLSDIHWIADHAPLQLEQNGSIICDGVVRYHGTPASCVVRPSDGGKLAVTFDRSNWCVSPGQTCVLYSGDICLGCGTIESTGINDYEAQFSIKL